MVKLCFQKLSYSIKEEDESFLPLMASNTTAEEKKQLCSLWNILINQTSSKKTINKRQSVVHGGDFASEGRGAVYECKCSSGVFVCIYYAACKFFEVKTLAGWSQLRTYFLHRVFNYQSFDNGL